MLSVYRVRKEAFPLLSNRAILTQRYHTMALRRFTRHLGVNTSALSRRASRPNAEVIVIADFRYKLGLKHIPIADCKVRHHSTAIGHRHLEAISAAAFQSKGKGCIRDHRTDSGGSPHTLPAVIATAVAVVNAVLLLLEELELPEELLCVVVSFFSKLLYASCKASLIASTLS